jgi:hypothetical protein
LKNADDIQQDKTDDRMREDKRINEKHIDVVRKSLKETIKHTLRQIQFQSEVLKNINKQSESESEH